MASFSTISRQLGATIAADWDIQSAYANVPPSLLLYQVQLTQWQQFQTSHSSSSFWLTSGRENANFAQIWGKQLGAGISEDWDSEWLHKSACLLQLSHEAQLLHWWLSQQIHSSWSSRRSSAQNCSISLDFRQTGSENCS